MAHQWHFFRAGGVDQVSLRDSADLLALDQLDQKLWVALAMPTRDIDIDPATLDVLDVDKDGRIRVHDILSAVAWIKTTFKDAGKLLTSADSVPLGQLSDAKILATAKRMLADLGKKDATSISLDDAAAITKAFADTLLNGDGVVIPASTQEAELSKAIEDAIAACGSVTDRSGKPGVDTDKANAFFAEVDKLTAWKKKAQADAALLPLGDATAAASDAYAAIAGKLEDYFARCRLAAYDTRAGAALAGQETDYQAMASKQLSTTSDEIARLPLAAIDANGRLLLASGVNPAWAGKLATFVEAAVKPLLGARDALTAEDVATIAGKLAPYQAWQADQPTTSVGGLEAAWLDKLSGTELRKKLEELIAADAALADEYAELASVEKAVRFQRDFGRILRNFVNFSDFYSRQDAVFQAGTLYLDARAARLCVFVSDEGKHATLAAAAGAYLAYCSITRQGTTKQVACAITDGDADNVFVGRNGIFYDRAGDDWDATVTKIISNPISVREAFWSPYKKLIRTIEETVSKRAEAAQAASDAKMTAAGTAIGNADTTAAPAPKEPPKKIDVGTVAAIGVAIGGIGAMLGGIFGTILGLGKWLPLGILGLLLAISGPSMAIAWLKLRKRNLGPLLDANNWAVNGSARINVSFGRAMTSLAELPSGAHRSMNDPFADKRSPWRLYAVLAIVLGLALGWYFGKLDGVLPEAAQSTTILKERAPRWPRYLEEKAKAKALAPAATEAAPPQ